MGSSLHVHVGPYLACEEPVTVTTVDRCAEHARGDAAFCSICGLSNGHRYSNRYAFPSDGFDYDDRLSEANSHRDEALHSFVCLSNLNTVPHVLVSRDDDAGCFDIPDALGSVAAFESVHAEDIAALRALGVTVTVKFGIVTYYS